MVNGRFTLTKFDIIKYTIISYIKYHHCILLIHVMQFLGINMIGSFALGTIIAQGSSIKRTKVLCLGTGFCGAFTTFSTFSVDIVLLFDKGKCYSLVVMIDLSIIFNKGLVID